MNMTNIDFSFMVLNPSGSFTGNLKQHQTTYFYTCLFFYLINERSLVITQSYKVSITTNI